MARRTAYFVVAAAVVAALIVVVPKEPLAVVEVGSPDSVVPQWAAGAPVWVVNDGGRLLVLDAVNPHPWWGMDELVGWCDSAGGFQAWWDQSRFDRQGRWMFGPAPRDLDRYEVASRQGRLAALGNVIVSEGRSAVSETPEGAWCRGDGSEGPDARYHDATRSGRDVFEGRIVFGPGAVPTFCAGDGTEVGCSTEALRVVGVQPQVEETTIIVGRFLARQRGDELHDVIYLPAS